jgi:hypothetical protein
MSDASPDLSSVKLLPPGNTRGSVEFKAARREARAYLEFFNWVSAIKAEYLGYRCDGVIYVFLFEFLPAKADVGPEVAP